MLLELRDADGAEAALREAVRVNPSRDKLGSVGFKAGHPFAHKGWKFGSSVVVLG